MANSGTPVGATAVWPLQDAKARFSEVVRRAIEHGPQHVSVRGEPTVVVLSEELFAALMASRPSIVDHLLSGPPWDEEFIEAVNARSSDPGRDVDL